MQKIMTHGVKHYNITFYQETSLQYYGKTFCIVVTVFNKKIKKKNIIMQFSVLGNNNYTITNKNIILTEFSIIGSIRNKQEGLPFLFDVT